MEQYGRMSIINGEKVTSRSGCAYVCLKHIKKNICMCTEKYQKGYILNFKLNDYLGEY